MAMGVLLFPSIHFALRAEKLLKGKISSVKLIPVPRHLSSDCGVCLRIPWGAREEIVGMLKEAGVKVEGIHLLSNKEE
jgi:hypothetical protein